MTSRIFIADLLFREGLASRRWSERKRRGRRPALASISCRGLLSCVSQHGAAEAVPVSADTFMLTDAFARTGSFRANRQRRQSRPALAIISSGVKAGVFRENALAGNVIDFDPRTYRILEQH